MNKVGERLYRVITISTTFDFVPKCRPMPSRFYFYRFGISLARSLLNVYRVDGNSTIAEMLTFWKHYDNVTISQGFCQTGRKQRIATQAIAQAPDVHSIRLAAPRNKSYGQNYSGDMDNTNSNLELKL